MPKDNRLYANITLDFADHPKILPLSDAAFRCLIEATLWSRKHMTNGLLPRRFAIVRWNAETLHELTTNDTQNPSLIEREDGWIIHDFDQHQTTKEEIEQRRDARKIAGQKGGRASGEARRKQNEANAKQTLKQTRSKTKPETETETDKELTTDVVSSSPRKRGTRLTPDFQPDQSTITLIRAERPDIDLDAETRKFVDYWTAKPGRDATKLDWNATWRNWMRNARQQSPNANGQRTHKLRALADLAAEVREIETTNERAIRA